jgi:hypothetical protein
MKRMIGLIAIALLTLTGCESEEEKDCYCYVIQNDKFFSDNCEDDGLIRGIYFDSPNGRYNAGTQTVRCIND